MIGASARHVPLPLFFLLAFAVSWGFWLPSAAASWGWFASPLSPDLSRLLGVFGPTLAALLLIAVVERRAGLRALGRRLRTWQVGYRWYLFVLLWPPGLSLAALGLRVALGGPVPDFAHPPILKLYPLPEGFPLEAVWALLPLIFLQQGLLGSALGEEIGWRGLALPRLQEHRPALTAAVLLGLIWGFWHLPLYLTQGDPIAATPFAWLLAGIVADSILFTWVFNHTRGSLLPVLLFHSAIAVTGLFLAAPAQPWTRLGLEWLVVLGIVAWHGPRYLSRQRAALDLPSPGP
jgi:membrane protease YdiL (CAAX protease family)